MTTNQIDPEDIELKATAVGCDLLLLISGGFGILVRRVLLIWRGAG